MGYIVFGILLVTAIIAFKKKMWLLFGFCCLLMLIGIAVIAYLVHFMNTFSTPGP